MSVASHDAAPAEPCSDCRLPALLDAADLAIQRLPDTVPNIDPKYIRGRERFAAMRRSSFQCALEAAGCPRQGKEKDTPLELGKLCDLGSSFVEGTAYGDDSTMFHAALNVVEEKRTGF